MAMVAITCTCTCTGHGYEVHVRGATRPERCDRRAEMAAFSLAHAMRCFHLFWSVLYHWGGSWLVVGKVRLAGSAKKRSFLRGFFSSWAGGRWQGIVTLSIDDKYRYLPL